MTERGRQRAADLGGSVGGRGHAGEVRVTPAGPGWNYFFLAAWVNS
jgi:hypothetical protein